MEGTIGEIRIVAYNFAPRTWAFCNGQILSIAQNTALFSILGTQYGGNGQTTFALPDYRGRVPISHGTGPGLPYYSIGEVVGAENVTLTLSTMGAHSHTIINNLQLGDLKIACHDDSDGNVSNPANANPAIASDNMYSNTQEGGLGGHISVTIGGAMSLDNTGGGQSHSNVQPYLAMNYVICEYGIFPSRN